MNTVLLRIVTAAFVALLALAPASVMAQDNGDGAEEEHGGGSSFVGGPDWADAKEVTVWSIVSIGGFATLMGVLYLFKRKVGGFPQDPSWVAPISVMKAGDLPDDSETAHGGEHEAHGTHALAH